MTQRRARAQAKKAGKPVKEMRPEERKLLGEIIASTVESLNLPALITVAVREHLKQGNPSEGYGLAQAVGTGSISAAPAAPVDQNMAAHEAIARAWGHLGKCRDRWYKTTAQLARVSPLGPDFNNAVVDVDAATHEMLSAAESYRLIASGIVSV